MSELKAPVQLQSRNERLRPMRISIGRSLLGLADLASRMAAESSHRLGGAEQHECSDWSPSPTSAVCEKSLFFSMRGVRSFH